MRCPLCLEEVESLTGRNVCEVCTEDLYAQEMEDEDRYFDFLDDDFKEDYR